MRGKLYICAQVVGAVGWDDQRLAIPDDVAPAMRQLIAACFGEPLGRPTFRCVRMCWCRWLRQQRYRVAVIVDWRDWVSA
jgi:hypothetical protein